MIHRVLAERRVAARRDDIVERFAGYRFMHRRDQRRTHREQRAKGWICVRILHLDLRSCDQVFA